MSDLEGNSYSERAESPDVSREEVKGNIRTRGKTKLTGFPRDLKFLDFHFNSKKRITGANQNSRLGTYKNTNLILKTTE